MNLKTNTIIDNMKNISIYIHIPFCKKKCLYCDFNSITNYTQEDIDFYIRYVIKEIDAYSKYLEKYAVSTIFIGGGTPSVLNEHNIEDLFNFIKKKNNILPTAEISFECNPESFTISKAEALKYSGVNRLSFGVQSLDNKVLNQIGRLHNNKDVYNSIEIAKKTGFKNINLDIMYGLPGQTLDSHLDTVNEIIKLSPTHISAYNLIIEEKTPIFKLISDEKIRIADEDLQVLMYEKTVDLLNKFEYKQYEISNYCLNNCECKHNINYWTQQEYIGFGLSAHSYMKFNDELLRFNNPSSFKTYYSNVDGRKIFPNYESIDKEGQKLEFIMLNLRMNKGILLSDYYSNFNEKLQNKAIVSNLVTMGLIELDQSVLKLSKKGMKFHNYVVMKLLD